MGLNHQSGGDLVTGFEGSLRSLMGHVHARGSRRCVEASDRGARLYCRALMYRQYCIRGCPREGAIAVAGDALGAHRLVPFPGLLISASEPFPSYLSRYLSEKF